MLRTEVRETRWSKASLPAHSLATLSVLAASSVIWIIPTFGIIVVYPVAWYLSRFLAAGLVVVFEGTIRRQSAPRKRILRSSLFCLGLALPGGLIAFIFDKSNSYVALALIGWS